MDPADCSCVGRSQCDGCWVPRRTKSLFRHGEHLPWLGHRKCDGAKPCRGWPHVAQARYPRHAIDVLGDPRADTNPKAKRKGPRAGGSVSPRQDATHADASFDLYGAGGLVSNSGDLNYFTRALHTGRVLSNAFLQLMLTTEKTGYSGCGIFNDTFAGQQAWGHRGFRAAWAYYLPTLDLYISGTNGVGGDGLDLNPLVQSVIDHGCLRLNIGDATDMAG
ncbi:uncharacterized protein HMPREF1120_06450 [Exophiala dermatitidis NIH/UT8656]|uniref:Uncharacterized protein n=1 Tax=Exophiala dermatitidis (strain ATCC 34100 / CBS 525.76 / NIH/UT8656) TaxID=858893 RepID=H6C4A4_EXODN|nr:uncharacterized protein HMPREF1120_06450 [Exophiala dermatitidis NIH/UT8656]EHY58440.1 hypothetical protein HMPREF1120_06450 [Exophiala dermatitidis NIH/UT8656]